VKCIHWLNSISLKESESEESVSTRREEEDSTEDVADIRQILIDYCIRNPVNDDNGD